ncbi:MAG: Copper amine oxidase-like domain-containing protein [Clostridia bacterium 41_269]|nr:MAG: Copper amine oxidase-like domain-containing protein [Clostridia bacterium 41_269]
MKISRTRKKSIALIVTLAFLMTLFPMALPAFAASYSRVGSLVFVGDDDVFDLNDVNIKIDQEDWGEGSVTVRLPSGFEIRKADKTTIADGDYIRDNYISVVKGVYGAQFDVTSLRDNEFKLEITDKGTATDDVTIRIKFDNIYVDKGFDGDIVAKFKAPSGSIFDNGEVVIGRVTGGEVTVEVVDDETFGDDGGEVTIRLEEDRPGALEVAKESVKFVLPKGFKWGQVTKVNVINGDLAYNTDFSFIPDGDELCLKVDKSSNQETWIEFTATIEVVDERDADKGDVVAKVRGKSSVTPSEITVGAYGDYALNVTADEPTTVYAGMLGQEIADFTLEEEIDGSLVQGRTITLTLPDWAKWGTLPDVVKDGGTDVLELVSFPGQDGTVAKYRVKNVTSSAAELDFEDMEVVLSPDAPEGDLEIEIGGTATDKLTVKVAEVKKPVEVTVDSVPTIVIGKADQAIGTLTITEAEAGILEEGRELVITLPKDVEWDDYKVEVTNGDLEVDVDDDGSELTITIGDESNDASTIKITATVTVYRTVPEGKVKADIEGDAVAEVNTHKWVEDYYGSSNINNGEIKIGNIVAIDDYDEDDGLFEDADEVASVVVANVGTPAGVGISKAVFTIGSTTYTIDGVEQTMDVAPYIKDSRTYLPVRYVGKALGISDQNILWSGKTATFIKGDRVVQVTIGSKTMLVNGAKVEMDVAPEIVNGRTMLPIRWIGVAFGAQMSWDNEAKTVTIEP